MNLHINRKIALVTCSLILVAVFTACKTTPKENTVQAARVIDSGEFDGKPVTITWNRRSQNEAINSYSAEVSVYSMNSRTDVGMNKTNRYNLSTKQVNGDWHTRMDFAREYVGGIRDLSVVSNAQKTILFDGDNVFDVEADVISFGRDLSFLTGANIFTAIDLKRIEKEAIKIHGCLVEEKGDVLCVTLPEDLFNFNNEDEGNRRVSTEIRFDKKNNTLSSIHLVDDRINDIAITNTYFMYQDIYGVPVKTGAVTEMIVNAHPINDLQAESESKIVKSIDEVVEVNDAEYKALMQNGAVPVDFMFFGDMSNLSYVETVIEIYQNIEINSVKDSAFEKLFDKQVKAR